MISQTEKINAIVDDVDNWKVRDLITYAKDLLEEDLYRRTRANVDSIYSKLELEKEKRDA